MNAKTPGLVCAHHHLYSALARGMPPPAVTPTDFAEILERIWWRLDVALDLEAIRWSALLGAVEALEAGTTAIVDHHASPSARRASTAAWSSSTGCASTTTSRFRCGLSANPSFVALMSAKS